MSSVALAGALRASDEQPILETTLFQQISARAQQLARTAYQAPPHTASDALANLNYDQYRSIRFKPEAAIWRGTSLFEAQLFHTGSIYREAVRLHFPTSLADVALPFDPHYFNYDGSAAPLASQMNQADKEFGYSGFRLHYPINTPDYKDEFVVFQGASYFRLIGKNQVYGISARGLALDTAMTKKEEFPVFREFWLMQAKPTASSIMVFALMDSPSISAAYRFEIRPGLSSTIDVTARLFARKAIQKLGIAPLTSMYFIGENRLRNDVDVDADARPEIHDSDGLSLHTNAGEWIWRALSNRHAAQTSAFIENNPAGFGLLQRDQDFAHYQDQNVHYEKRPGLWITPHGAWGKGRIELVELPTNNEFNDNIVAYWVSQQALNAGQQREIRYRVQTLAGDAPSHHLAKVINTRSQAGTWQGQREFILDFQSDAIKPIARVDDVTVSTVSSSTSSGKLSAMQIKHVSPQLVQLRFTATPDGTKAMDMRISLTSKTQRRPASEVWSYLWLPNDPH